MADVFVSYSRADSARVEMLVRALAAHNISVWWDRSLEQNADFGALIRKEIADAGAVVVCWSDAASNSRWVREEADEANHLGKYVGCLISSGRAAMGFNTLNNANLQSWNGAADDRQLLALLRDVGQRLKRSEISDLAEAEEARLAEESRQRQAKEEAARVAAALERKREEEARQLAATAGQRKRAEFERLARMEADSEISARGLGEDRKGIGCVTWAICSLITTSVIATAFRMMAPARCHTSSIPESCTQEPAILMFLLFGVLGAVSFWGAPFIVKFLNEGSEEKRSRQRDEIEERMRDRVRRYRPD